MRWCDDCQTKTVSPTPESCCESWCSNCNRIWRIKGCASCDSYPD